MISNNGRAWVEIDLDAIAHNAGVLKALVSDGCRICPVVKANAYGHGDLMVAKKLMNAGYDFFAVATAFEGEHLRKNGIKGDILILGYTSEQNLGIVVENDLIQTVFSEEYADTVLKSGKNIRAHIKLDTGMHRIGFSCDDTKFIKSIYKNDKIRVEGIYTHLCAADSDGKSDLEFTQSQIDKFYGTVEKLRADGINTGLLHLQNTYGIINYPQLKADLARPGIALYGVLGENGGVFGKMPDIKPALSLKARISMVKSLEKGETISYGRTFTTEKKMKVATVSIGYADGIQRDYSAKGGYVLVKSRIAPIIGRICMDQFIIDVTDIPDVVQNDIAVIIGRDGDKEIRAEDVAERCGTISYEMFVRLNCRVDYVYLNE